MPDDNTTAILDLLATDCDGNLKQGNVFLTKLYQETVLYPTPTVTLTIFKGYVQDSADAITAAEKGGDVEIATRTQTTLTLHNAMSDKLIPYINSMWKGNRVNLEKSGAKISAVPSKVPPPDQPVIKKIVAGTEEGSVKIFLVRGIKSTDKKRSKKQYRIIMFENENDVKGVEVGSSWDSRKLYAYGVPYSVYRYFGVRAENSGGSSLLSIKGKYFLLP
jgi:hypothetical protein